MKKQYLFLIIVFLAQLSFSQIITIPDANFKDALINDNVVDTNGDGLFDADADTNDDGEIDVAEAHAVYSLDINLDGIFTLTGIEYFVNLVELYCIGNYLTSLDLSQSPNLEIIRCNYNSLTSLDFSQNPNLIYLECHTNSLTSLDITQNTNLITLHCPSNSLTSLDVTQNINLETLNFHNNSLTSIDVTQNSNLKNLYCIGNSLTSLDTSQNPNLEKIICSNNLFTSLDFSQNPNLIRLTCEDNALFESLNIKNGTSMYDYDLSNNPNLGHVCVDEDELSQIETEIHVYEGYTDCVINSYCSFEPGGNVYHITGQSNIDINADGCDTSEPIFPNLKFNITDGIESGSYISDTSGNFDIALNAGTYTVTPELESSSYFTVSPSSITVDFPTDGSPYIQNFCIVPSGTHNDLEVVIVPLELARPGFDTNYKIVYKNKGNTSLSGSVVLNFDDDFMNLVTASPTEDSASTGTLTWDFSALAPFETRSIEFTMNLNTPTDATFPLFGGETLNFAATINPVAADETPADNVAELNQGVVNSYDPNDKTCLEGIWIPPSMVGEYVHYLIRFENTGTASAVNIVVKDDIDPAYYDINTLVPLDSSHSFVTNIDNDKVEFIFENINLPFDDANNDGYVLFKIKTLSSLVLNDTFKNKAEIYFDFNPPIITNEAETLITNNPLSVTDVTINQSIQVYPKPAKDILHINGNSEISVIDIFDLNGRQLQKVSFINADKNIELDIKGLTKGLYIIKITSEKGVFTDKLLKE